MRTIYKYPLTFGVTQLQLPQGAKILSVGEQDTKLVLWAFVETNNPTETRTVFPYETGEEIKANRQAFIGSVQIKRAGDYWLYHIFELL